MSPTPKPQDQPEQPERPGTPQAERAETTDATEAPGAQKPAEAQRSRLATDGDPTLSQGKVPQPHTSVEWVRPTDLAARGAGTTLGRGTEMPAQLAAAVKTLTHQQRGTLGQRLAERGEALEPATSERTRTPAVERDGVSR